MKNNKLHARRENNRIQYYDISSLERSPLFPESKKKIIGIFVAIAVVIGIGIFSWYNYTFLQASSRAQAAVDKVLSEAVAYQFPSLSTYFGMTSDEILADLDANGISYFIVTTQDSTSNNVTIYHNPSTLSVDEAKTYYEKGIDNLNSYEAASLLYGGWELTMSPEAYGGIRLRYADFSSKDIESAITKALGEQALSTLEVTESGKDVSGNTYKTGPIDLEEESYAWRVSALELSNVYKVKISDKAIFVGIKLSKE